MQSTIGVKVANLKSRIQQLCFCGVGLTTQHPPSSGVTVPGCASPCRRRWVIINFLNALPSHKLYLNLWEIGVYNP